MTKPAPARGKLPSRGAPAAAVAAHLCGTQSQRVWLAAHVVLAGHVPQESGLPQSSS
jgi:hypothetical protein